MRPISSAIANRIIAAFVGPNAKKHLAMLDGFVSEGGKYLCGDSLTAADILMSYPLIAAKDRFYTMGSFDKGTPQATYPQLFEYIERLESEPGYVQSVQKVKEIDDSYAATPLKGQPRE